MARILIVDDEAGIRRSMRKMLEREGHEITECGDGAEALAILERSTFELIITDLHMPNFDGLALARTLRKWPAAQPRVVVISGSGEGSIMEMANALGATATLPKPFTRDDLLTTLAKAMTS